MSGRTRVRLGSGYRRLWTATAVSSLGDGVYFTALPLLAASLTRDPVAVSLVTLATTLPNLLLTLTAGCWSTAGTGAGCCGGCWRWWAAR